MRGGSRPPSLRTWRRPCLVLLGVERHSPWDLIDEVLALQATTAEPLPRNKTTALWGNSRRPPHCLLSRVVAVPCRPRSRPENASQCCWKSPRLTERGRASSRRGAILAHQQVSRPFFCYLAGTAGVAQCRPQKCSAWRGSAPLGHGGCARAVALGFPRSL